MIDDRPESVLSKQRRYEQPIFHYCEDGTQCRPQLGSSLTTLSSRRDPARRSRAFKTRAVRPKTKRDYGAIVTNHLNPEFGNQAINTIDRHRMTSFVAGMTRRGIKEGTAANIRRVLSMVLNEAARSGAIPRNPADGVKVRRSRRQEMVFLTRRQVEALAQSIANPTVRSGNGTRQDHFPALGFLVRLVSETGLRSGEAAALRVGDIDIKNRRIHVARSATEMPGGVIYNETKNYETRSVPMTHSIAAQMTEHLKTRPTDADALVFTNVRGEPVMHSRLYSRYWKRAVEQAVDVDGNQLIPLQTRFHDLRHTYATLLIAAGANPLTVKQRMGHSSITVTMDRYGHLFPHLEEDITEKMDQQYRE